MAKAITKGQLDDCLGRIADYFLQTNEDFSGATTLLAGEKGMVPQPTAGDNTKFLRGDGTWATPPGGGTGATYHVGPSQPSDTTAIWFKTLS